MPPSPSKATTALLYAVFLLSLTALVLWSAGLLELFLDDVRDGRTESLRPHAAILLGSALLTAGAGWPLWKRRGKEMAFTTIFGALIAIATLVFCNVAASLVVPPWPAQGLHGVGLEVAQKSWGKVTLIAGSQGFNSWGERDVERQESPPPGVKRVILVGDSLLEESSTVPVNVATEALVKDRHLEVVNLGVSASSPDEYYYRIRNIALNLHPSHVAMFLYAGNDLMQYRTLHTWYGIMATYPRDSLLEMLGLRALAHVIMNRHRPILGAWGTAGEVGAAEKAIADEVHNGSRQQLVDKFTRHVPEEKQAALRARLESPAMDSVFEMWRNPDAGLFRSYHVWAALEHAAGVHPPEVVSEDYPLQWVERSAALCKREGVDFTLVLVPEAFSVDARMQEQWAPLADMKGWSAQKTAATQRLGARAAKEGINVLDLYPVLDNTRGTYFNLDGHWSQAGVDLVARALASKL